MNKQQVRDRIMELGIIPAIRVTTLEDAMFAVEALSRGGIPIVEVGLIAQDSHTFISHLTHNLPEVIVGAGSLLDAESARRCLDAGAKFLTSDGLDLDTVKFALQTDAVVIPGALTPTDIIAAWKLRPDFIKVVPCSQVGGESYIRALKSMFPSVPMIAAGGVNQQTASNFILSGATALGIGGDLIPKEAIRRRQADRIAELARRFINSVRSARVQAGMSAT